MIHPCVWHDGTALAAAEHYAAVFPDGAIAERSPTPDAETPPTVVTCRLAGAPLMLLNGGPHFRPNPSISAMVRCGEAALVDELWRGLTEGAPEPLMPLGSYAWSPRYGWLRDRWGFTWQLMHDETLPAGAAAELSPALLFTGERFGRAAGALGRYAAVLPDSGEPSIEAYADDSPSPGKVLFGELGFAGGGRLVAMDGPGEHAFAFGEGVSLVVHCADQAELDAVWDGLIAGGGTPSRCGWLRDAFGVSWQVLPQGLSTWLADPDTGPAAMRALMTMDKLDIARLHPDPGA